MVVLFTLLMVAFLMRAGTERQAAGFYRAEATTHELSDTTINLVEGLINEATSQTGGAGVYYSWASQPGAIRVFDQTGAASKVFKLYSASSMSATMGNGVTPSSFLSPDNPANLSTPWYTAPAAWVDLNAPINTDPNPDPTTKLGTPQYTHFPIVDPRDPTDLTKLLSAPTGGTPKLDGFFITNAPQDTVKVDSNTSNAVAINPAPMPVQWLYLLQDGHMIAPDSGCTTVATFTNTIAPTEANPIIGRIAFWTDDETCKININTAAGDGLITTGNDASNIAKATFWDTPRFFSPDDVNLAEMQPMAGEYQRYPGHPGTVALINTLNSLGLNSTGAAYTTEDFAAGGISNNYYNALPRYAFGGSQGATLPTGVGQSGPPLNPIQLVSNRLFPTVGEMLFQPTLSSSARNVSTLNPGMGRSVEKARFFLSAHSRAPELNLFGLPRVCVWPISDPNLPPASNSTTAVDKLIAFDSTLAGMPYYFTRQSLGMTGYQFYTAPWGTSPYGPNGCFTPFRDLSLTINNNSATPTSIYRNQQLLSYLSYLGTLGIPGYGSTSPAKLSTKYGTFGLQQILTEMFDYIRITNVCDCNVGVFYMYPWMDPGYFPNGGGWEWGQYEVAPAQIPSSDSHDISLKWSTQGAGIMPVLTQVAIHIVGNGVRWSSQNLNVPLDPETVAYSNQNRLNMIDATTIDPSTGNLLTDNTMGVQAFLLLNFSFPVQFRQGFNPEYMVEMDVTNPFGLQVGPPPPLPAPQFQTLSFPSTAIMTMENSCVQGFNGLGMDNDWGTMPWTTFPMNPFWAHPLGQPTANTTTYFPFYSNIIGIPIDTNPADAAPLMTLHGGTVVVKIYDNACPQSGGNPIQVMANVVQTYNIQFPNSPTVPEPALPKDSNNKPVPWSNPVIGTGSTKDRWTYPNINPSVLINSQDVVRSMELSPAWSDLRLLTAYSGGSGIPTSAFSKHPDYDNVAAWNASNLFFSVDSPQLGVNPANLGRLVKNMDYTVGGDRYTGMPVGFPNVPPADRVNGVKTESGAPGDWDNGMGHWPDGPYINKADEGSMTPSANGWMPYFQQGNGSGHYAASWFSPNREIPSPGMFGSLPTGLPELVHPASEPVPTPSASTPEGWQTLLFRPGPGAAGMGVYHPGEAGYARDGSTLAGAPPDHVFLDLFWMPIAEPYAISEPCSTAGKVNLNYQIVPFGYITRATALRAALAGEKVAKSPGSDSKLYKAIHGTYNVGQTKNTFRLPIDLDQTLTQFDSKFSTGGPFGDVFRSASQICDVFLVPKGYTASSFPQQWYDDSVNGDFALVGDNTRERPYTDIYQKVTTKSNTFTVYYRVQALKNPPTVNPGTWDETKGGITGEYRGSTTIERFIDPNEKLGSGASVLPDAVAQVAAGSVPTSLEPYYKWRVVENHQFAP